MRLFVMVAVVLSSTLSFAGRGGSTAAIHAAVQSGSADAIVAEIERAEYLACLSCIDAVLPLVDHDSARVRDAAGWWLGRRGVRVEVLANMNARLGGSDPIAARNAADVLGGMRDISALTPLANYLSRPLDEESGAAVARALGAIGHPTSTPALVSALGSSLAGVRAQAAASLRDLRAPRGQTTAAQATALVPLLGDGDAGVRRQAALTLGFIGQSGGDTSAALTALSSVATSDGAASVRKAAAWALGETKNGNARAALQQAQSDSDALVRSVATAALANLR